MRKKLISCVLALVMAISLLWGLPQKAVAADPVEMQIRAYADSIDQKDADTAAAKALTAHGMTGKGKKLVMDEGDALTAVLLNSELMQRGLAGILTEAIACMQQLDMQAAPALQMSFSWNDSTNKYVGYMKTDTGKTADSLNWLFCDVTYATPRNAYDNALEWMVAWCNADAEILCIADSDTEKTYRVTMTIGDRFDFSIANTAGFKQLFSGMGMLLFREFDWSCTVTMDLTLPYSYDRCSHGAGAYHWTLDGENHAMSSDGSGVYTQNDAVHQSKTVSDGSVHHYYALEKTVRLLHNKPWVVEYDVRKPVRVSFEPVHMAVTKTYPHIRHASNQSVHVTTKDYAMALNENGGEDRYYAYNYCGTKLWDYTYNALHTFRLENEVSADGSNMLYLTVTNRDSGQVCLDRVPMDDYSYYGGWMDATELRDTESKRLVGKDIYINYFGSETFGLGAEYLDIRIWENGENAADTSYMESTVVQGSCTERGYTTHTCTRCGYSYTDGYTEVGEHRFGEYVFDNNAGCTEDGTQTASCTLCGETSTVAAPDTAAGHSYTETVTEASCTRSGYTAHTCSRCGDTYADNETDMLPHSVVTDAAVAPSCGRDGRTEGSHCEVCGTVIKKQETVPPTGEHRMDEGIVTKAPTHHSAGIMEYTCLDCGMKSQKPIPALSLAPFTDVEESDWFYLPVLWAVGRDVTSGKTETTFAPHEGCTRAQVVTFLWAANGKPAPKSMENSFTDVADDAWYAKAVLWAVENGITGGVGEGLFGPEETCTRGQIVTFLWAANGKPAVSGESEFSDVADTDWYAAPVIWAAENQVTGGIGEGMFGPNAACTRAQVVTFLYKLYG